MSLQVKLTIPNCICIKDPQETKLGELIMQNGIELIDEIGFEAFTFKKLAEKINSTEASIYRYFENKHQFLMFLYAWYWGKTEYQIQVETMNLTDTKEKLDKAIHILIDKNYLDSTYSFINEKKLKRIIENEGLKSILNKKVDEGNKNGAFTNYKNLVGTLSNWILEIIPTYPYPKMLVTSIIESAHLQHFFANHLPRLTDTAKNHDNVVPFFTDLLNIILTKNKVK